MRRKDGSPPSMPGPTGYRPTAPGRSSNTSARRDIGDHRRRCWCLEENPQSHFCNARAVIAGDLAVVHVAERGVRIFEVRVIEGVVELAAKLYGYALADREVAHQRRIPVVDSGSEQREARLGAGGKRRRHDKGVCVEPLAERPIAAR